MDKMIPMDSIMNENTLDWVDAVACSTNGTNESEEVMIMKISPGVAAMVEMDWAGFPPKDFLGLGGIPSKWYPPLVCHWQARSTTALNVDGAIFEELAVFSEVELIASPAPEVKKLCCGPAVLHQIQVLAVLFIDQRISFQHRYELSLGDILDHFRTNRSHFEEGLPGDEELPHSCPTPLCFQVAVVQRGSPHFNGLQFAEIQGLGPDLVAMEDYLAF
jgi:hypothetical protein